MTSIEHIIKNNSQKKIRPLHMYNNENLEIYKI